MDYSFFDTGDILLFHGVNYLGSWIIEYFTHSKWSHIGIVLKDPTYIDKKLKGLYLWESGKEQIKDSQDDKFKLGVQITPLKEVIEKYTGGVSYRKLHFKIDEKELCDKLTVTYNTTHDKPYDTNLFDYILTYFQIEKTFIDERKVDEMFCSAFVGYIYTQLGLLSKETKWTILQPKFFSSENKNLKLLRDATLDKEIKIK